MSSLFITDNLQKFRSNESASKLYYFDCYLKEQSGFDQNKIDRFNFTSATTIEFKGADHMHTELDKILLTLPIDLFHPNKYIREHSKRDQIYAYFYDYFKKYVLLKHMFLLTLEQFFEQFSSDFKFDKIKLHLSTDLQLIESDLESRFPALTFECSFYNDVIIPKFNPRFARIKKMLYPLYDLLVNVKAILKPKIKRGKYHFLLLTYDVSSDSLLLEHFFELVRKSTDLSLSIVQIATGMENKFTYSFTPFACENIDVYRFEEFRKYARQNKNDNFFSFLQSNVPSFKCLDDSNHFKATELHYEWVNNMIDKTNPSICIYTNQAEMGRVLTQVARYKNVPSVFVEYSFTFNSPFLKSNIAFDVRACINALTAINWKKNDDPSEYRLVLGYCKHDFLSKKNPNRPAFFGQNSINENQKTLLFASTWCSGNKIYDDEKAEILHGLSNTCYKNNWNLIVKKHPVEIDLIVDEVIRKNNFPNQKVFTNSQLSLSEAVQLADFMCCQSSSAILDSVFFEKPFAFISLTDGESLADYLFADKKSKIQEFHTIPDIEKFLMSLFNETETVKEIQNNARALKRDLLYLADGNACGRLVDFSKNLIDKGSLDTESLVALQIEKI